MKKSIATSLNEKVKKLKAYKSPSKRELAAEEIGDQLKVLFSDLTLIDNQTVKKIFNDIMTLTLNETNPATKESLLNVLVDISSLACAKQEYIDPQPIAESISSFNEAELEYALYVLAFSRNTDYQKIIENYLHHSNPNIKTVAHHALREIEA